MLVTDGVGNWFEVRDMPVDRVARLVKVDGYRALAFAAYQAY